MGHTPIANGRFQSFCNDYHPRERSDNVFALCVCLCVSLSRCLSGRFNPEGLVPHKQYFAGTLLGCLVVQVMFHALTTSSMTSPGHKSNFEIDISPSIFELEHRSKAQNMKMLMAIFASSKWRPFWKFWNIKHSFNLTSHMKRSSQIMP